ncbi:hypothetical protein ACIBQ0_39525, partial [Nocardia nova]|uniref:hypothetical protein n=1 Tax=Nocardia nova TaxID=37330 RepID=UPI003797E2AB
THRSISLKQPTGPSVPVSAPFGIREPTEDQHGTSGPRVFEALGVASRFGTYSEEEIRWSDDGDEQVSQRMSANLA